MSAAAVLAANLARRGHREFDVRREFDARESRRARTRRRRSLASSGAKFATDRRRPRMKTRRTSDASPTMSPTMTPRLFAEVSRRNDAYDRAPNERNRRRRGAAEAKRAEQTAAERRRARRRALAARDESEHPSQRALPLVRTRSRVAERTRSESPESLELESLAYASRLGDEATASARLNPPTRPREGWEEDPDATCDTRDTRDTRARRGGWSATRDVSTFRAIFLAASRSIRAVVRAATVSRARRSEAPLPPGRTRGVSDRRRGDAPHASDTERGDGGRRR